MSGPDADFTDRTEPVLGELPPRDTTALVRTVRDRLRLAISLEEIPSGTRLNQVAVAKQLGVSRMPVRTAISELVSEGLLEMVPGGGVAVRSLTPDDLLDVYEVREAIESRAVRRVAQLRPAEGLARIEQVVSTHKPRVTGYGAAELLAADREFHMAVLDATGNEYFRRALVPVWSIVERGMVRSLHITDVFTGAWDEHEAIAKALLAGDADHGEQLLLHHLRNASSKLAQTMPTSSADET
ncbi:GntR family transcriptional regulator [Streptomyces sp. NPDC047002]|uniref:GntR family transcriptional regulator n=1 Tax=Streptomyces sp. NPDC047002 TaxID=3155475 RepID=UPI0034551266